MSSSSLSIAQSSDPIKQALPEAAAVKNHSPKWAMAACAVAGVAGGVLLALAALNFFGGTGSIGFLASAALGGTLLCLSIAGLSWILFAGSKGKSSKDEMHTSQTITAEEEAALEAPKNNETITTVQAEAVKKYEERKEAFYRTAEARMRQIPVPVPKLPNTQTSEFIEGAKEAFYYFFRHTPKESPVKKLDGGPHECIVTDKIPEVVFKRKRGVADGQDNYIQIADRGREICEKNHLYLLYVPQCVMLDVDDEKTIMQERVEFLIEDWEGQKVFFEWAMNDPKLQPYVKELFRQLTVFICLMRFADVKYNNILIKKDGRIALFDLDEGDPIIGLTEGCAASEKEGLFNLIPHAWFDEFEAIAKQYLDDDSFATLQNKLPELKERAANREKRKASIQQFLAKRNITFPNQQLVYREEAFKKYGPEVALFAKQAIAYLNTHIATLEYFSPHKGRKIRINRDPNTPFFKSIVEDPLFSSKPIMHNEYIEIEKKGLEALQKEGYIFSYKVNPYGRGFFKVVC